MTTLKTMMPSRTSPASTCSATMLLALLIFRQRQNSEPCNLSIQVPRCHTSLLLLALPRTRLRAESLFQMTRSAK
jgi:hypothetical protein